MKSASEHTVVAGLPGDDDGVRFRVGLVYELDLHIVRCLDVMLTDRWVFISEQLQARPWDTAWGGSIIWQNYYYYYFNYRVTM